MAAKRKTRKNAGEGYGYMFHGAFNEKKDAIAKEKKTKGAWIKPTLTNKGYRYIVMSPRTNPIKRKKKVTPEEARNYLSYDFVREWSNATGERERKRLSKKLAQMKKIAPRENPDSLEKLRKMAATVARLAQKAAKKSDINAFNRHMNTLRMLEQEIHDKVSTGTNPHELLVMGANPSEVDTHNTQEISLPPGATILIRTPRQNPVHTETNPDRFTSLHARASGARYTPPALIQTKRQKRIAGLVRSTRARASQHKYDWIPEGGIAPGQNPGLSALLDVASIGTSLPGLLKKRRKNVELGTYENGVFHPWTRRPKSRQKKAIRRQNPDAAGIREDFTGQPVEWETTTDEPHMPAGDYAQLGLLQALYVKPRAGGQVQTISFSKPHPILVSDETARQLWFVDGDQDVTGSLDVFSAHDRGAGLFELGEARRIDYKQRKEHVPDPEIDEWRHEFGEETGERPTVLFDSRHKRLLLEGGAYQVRREGIVN